MLTKLKPSVQNPRTERGMKNNDETPRVLVLANNRIQPYTGGGVLLGNLFHKFPRSNIIFIHADDVGGGVNGCREYRLSLSSLRPQWCLLRILWNFCYQLMLEPSSIRRSELISLMIQGCKYTLSEKVDMEVRNFSPDIIYAWVGDSVWARVLVDCVKRYRIPYVIHFMDNHLELNGGSAVQQVLQTEYRRNLFDVVKGASRILTISTAMGHAYQQIFSKSYDVFHGLIDSALWPWPKEQSSCDVFSLVFTGSIESGQMNGLIDVADAVECLAAEGQRIELLLCVTEFYENRARKIFNNYRNIRYKRHPDFENLRSVLNNASVMVLAYGFDERSVQYYRYSFATKVVPYMLSGRCILAYGPPVIAPIDYLRRGGWGHVVSQPGVQNLAASIKELMLNPMKREEYARIAYTAGLSEHDLEENSVRFMDLLRRVANVGAEFTLPTP